MSDGEKKRSMNMIFLPTFKKKLDVLFHRYNCGLGPPPELVDFSVNMMGDEVVKKHEKAPRC